MVESAAQRVRGIRSFVLRQGRLTPAQRRAISEHYPRFGVHGSEGVLDLVDLFQRAGPVWLEIGFGNGITLAELAQTRPEINFLGAEVHGPGVGHLLLEAARRELANLRVAQSDGVALLRERIPSASLARVLILFPDPWHKKRHNKRRLIQPGFLDQLADKIAPNGHLHLATDWSDYGRHMADCLEQHPDFVVELDTEDDAQRPGYRLRTRFEARGLRLGHRVRDLVCRRLPA